MIMRQPMAIESFAVRKSKIMKIVSTLSSSLPMTKVQCTYANELNTNTVK